VTSIPEPPRQAGTPAASTRGDWKNTVLAGLANYIDAGSIVAGSVALAIWAKQFHLTSNFLGLIGAFSSNAISAGIGALIGGRLCDRVGRKKIYQWDMLVYAVGMLVLVFAVKPWMIVVGFVLAGLAVGADIPASWTLIAEMAPNEQRGQLRPVDAVRGVRRPGGSGDGKLNRLDDPDPPLRAASDCLVAHQVRRSDWGVLCANEARRGRA
jgi:hypothetical protein